MDTLFCREMEANMLSQPDRPLSEEFLISHTPENLAKRLAELEPKLHSFLPAEAADHGLDAARDAGLRYIERFKAREACGLTNGAAWLHKVATRAAFRYLKRHPRCVSSRLPCYHADRAVPSTEN